MTRGMDVETRGDLEIIVTRRFDAPARLVFAAHEKPELVKRWMYGPDGWDWVSCEIDFRAGGRFHYVWKHAESGEVMGIRGQFEEIVRPSRIVMREMMDSDDPSQATLTTVTLREHAGVTTMVMAQVYASRETRDMMAEHMPVGLEAGYARLDVVFAEMGERGMIWLKSIGVVIGAFILVGVCHVLTDLVLEKSGVFPPPESSAALGTAYLASAAVYRNLYNVLGGWVAARFAPRAPVGHAIALGLIGAAAATAGTIAMWHLGAHWYPITLAVLALPSCWLGGLLAVRGRKAVMA